MARQCCFGGGDAAEAVLGAVEDNRQDYCGDGDGAWAVVGNNQAGGLKRPLSPRDGVDMKLWVWAGGGGAAVVAGDGGDDDDEHSRQILHPHHLALPLPRPVPPHQPRPPLPHQCHLPPYRHPPLLAPPRPPLRPRPQHDDGRRRRRRDYVCQESSKRPAGSYFV